MVAKITGTILALVIVAKIALPHLVLAAVPYTTKPALASANHTAIPGPIAASPKQGAPTPYKPLKPHPTLKSIVKDIADTSPAGTGIVVHDFSNDRTAEYQATQPIPSASLYKLFVAYAAYDAIDRGQLSADTIVAGTSSSVATCLELMITISDNDCGYYLGSLVGFDKLDSQLRTEGFTGTILDNTMGDTMQTTTARDVARLLTRLHRGKLLKSGSTQQFLKHLRNQQRNDWLASGLPSGTVFAHKTGELNGYVHDAGIVQRKDGDYLIVFMSGPWPSHESSVEFHKDASSRLWRYFSEQ